MLIVGRLRFPDFIGLTQEIFANSAVDDIVRKKQQQTTKSGITRTFLDNSSFLKRFLRRILEHEQDVEDLAQEAYLKAFDAEQQQSIEHPRAFLFSVAKNLALNEMSRKSKQITAYIEECQQPYGNDNDDSAESLLEGKQALGVYCEAVASLPSLSRQIYLLRKVHGLRHQEIADRLDVSLSTVEKHLRMGAGVCLAAMQRYDSNSESGKSRKSSVVAVGKSKTK